MKINRLLEITMVLLNRKSITAGELADRFQVSTRTIYRDIDVLSVAGVPVYTNKGSGGGISLLDSYALNKAYLTDHERDSLILSLKTLKATKYPAIDAILDKISALFKNAPANDWVHVEFSPWWGGPEQDNQFFDIKRAILEFKIIRFDYINADGVKSHRCVEPMRLIFKSQAWYLSGFCRMREDFRTFRISRMKKLTVENESFQRRSLDSIKKTDPPNQQISWINLKLRFQPDVLYRLYDEYDEKRIKKNPDGTYDVAVIFPEDEWVYTHILSFGANVEVLEPEYVRNNISERLKKMTRIYQR